MSTAGLILVDTEHVGSAGLADVREFYRGVFRTEGWTEAVSMSQKVNGTSSPPKEIGRP